jgi:hypothetical protein
MCAWSDWRGAKETPPVRMPLGANSLGNLIYALGTRWGLPEAQAKSLGKNVSAVLNVLWMLTFGWFLALVHLAASFANLCFFFLIVTIPNIGGHWKLIRVAFLPFNKVIVPASLAQEIRDGLAKARLGL